MRNILQSTVFTTGLAIFSMLFGAGNLMYPIKAGLNSGDHFVVGILGFLCTAAALPLIGLVGIIYFNGNYKSFFHRLGVIPGNLLIGCCMAIIGPCYVMSRIVSVCHGMLAPFLPEALTIVTFSILFCALTFLATVKETKVIQLLGNLISPALLISLGVILVKGILHPQALVTVNTPVWEIFTQQAVLGYQHLDLLGTIFFGSIVLGILKTTAASSTDYDLKSLAKTGLQAGLLGCFLLTVVYVGMGLLGAFYGQGLENHDVAQLFSIISHKILGAQGALVIATAVAMACFSTIIALAAVLAEYIQHDVSQNKLGYVQSLAVTLLLTTVISWNGLGQLAAYAEPIINTLYPLLITLTFVNIAYKLWNFKPIKIPVLITLIVSMYLNWPSYAVYGITYGQQTTEQHDLK